MDDLPDTENPNATPDIFWMTIVERKRGGAQDADGWRVDHIKDIHVRPDENEDNDPLMHFREYCIAYASGRLPIAEDTYRMLARGKIAALAKPDSDQPRPAVVVDALRRIGMATLLKICKEELGTYFGKKSEYGVGVTAPSQKIAWGLKMCQEEEPTSIQFW